MDIKAHSEWVRITENAVYLLDKQYEELAILQSLFPLNNDRWDYYEKLIAKAIEYYETTIITAWNKLSPDFMTKNSVIPNEVKRIQAKMAIKTADL
jgi:hypothetical protein